MAAAEPTDLCTHTHIHTRTYMYSHRLRHLSGATVQHACVCGKDDSHVVCLPCSAQSSTCVPAANCTVRHAPQRTRCIHCGPLRALRAGRQELRRVGIKAAEAAGRRCTTVWGWRLVCVCATCHEARTGLCAESTGAGTTGQTGTSVGVLCVHAHRHTHTQCVFQFPTSVQLLHGCLYACLCMWRYLPLTPPTLCAVSLLPSSTSCVCVCVSVCVFVCAPSTLTLCAAGLFPGRGSPVALAVRYPGLPSLDDLWCALDPLSPSL